MSYVKNTYENRTIVDFDVQLIKHVLSKVNIQKNDNKKPKVLDIGCGAGFQLQIFSSLDFEVYGIDRDTPNEKLAKTYHITPCIIGLEKIPHRSNTFDIVFCKSFIEHTRNQDAVFAEAYRVLKPRGCLIMLTPSWEYNYKWFCEDHTHVSPLTKISLYNLYKYNGFIGSKVKYLYYLPSTWRFPFIKFFAKLTALLTRDKDRFYDEYGRRSNIWKRFSKEVQLFGIGYK